MILRVPATTANLGPGFDSMGMALTLYNTAEIQPSDTLSLPYVPGMRRDELHLTYCAMQQVWRRLGIPDKNISLKTDDKIPLGRGLGSSSACIVTGILAANHMEGDPLPRQTLMEMAAAMEGHPDNVVPAFLGGFTVSYWNGQTLRYMRSASNNEFKLAVYIPQKPLLTADARKVLPTMYSRQDAVFNASHAALTAAALITGDTDALAFAMEDRLHQPYRRSLIPGWDALEERVRAAGALAVCISGAGPSMLTLWKQGAFTPPDATDIPGGWILQPVECCTEGAQILG